MDPLVINLLAGGGRPSTLVSLDSATARAPTITVPAGVRNGDVGILLDAASNTGSTPASVTPSGWTKVQENSNFPQRQIFSVKVLTASDAGATVTGMSAFNEDKTLLVLRPDIPAATLTTASVNGQATSSAPTNQTVTASAGAVPLVVVAGYTSGTLSLTFSPTQDGTVSTTYQQLRYKIYNSSPADVTVGMSDGGNNAMQSFYLQVS